MPIAPALCCKSCISDKVVPADSCYDLNYCSGHGVCNLGVCECQEGFGGADCKYRVRPCCICYSLTQTHMMSISPFCLIVEESHRSESRANVVGTLVKPRRTKIDTAERWPKI